MAGGVKRQLVASLCLLVTVSSLKDFDDDAISSYRSEPGETVFFCPTCGRTKRSRKALICRTRGAHPENVKMDKWRGMGEAPPDSPDIEVGLA